MSRPMANLRRDPGAASLTYFLNDSTVSFGRDMVAWLKDTAMREGADSARICLHSGPADAFHQMVIVQRGGFYCRPHKHLDKAESCQIIDGELAFIVFSDGGEIDGVAYLGRADVIGRAEIGRYHMVFPLSDWCVYHEVKPGPFLSRNDSVVPSWAPATDDLAGQKRFLGRISESIAAAGAPAG